MGITLGTHRWRKRKERETREKIRRGREGNRRGDTCKRDREGRKEFQAPRFPRPLDIKMNTLPCPLKPSSK